MRRAVLLMGTVLAGLMLAGPAVLAQEQRLRPIGEIQFEPEPAPPQRGVFELDRDEQFIRALRFEAAGGSVAIRGVRLIYRDGQSNEVRVGERIRDGEMTTLIRLQEPREVRRIEVNYVPEGKVRIVLRADTRPAEPPPPPPPQWVEIGCKNVGFLGDRDILRLQGQDRYSALRFRVSGFDVELSNFGVTYVSGAQENYSVRAVIPAGSRTAPITLRGLPRSIDRIELFYRTRGLSTQKTQLCVEGMKARPMATEQ